MKILYIPPSAIPSRAANSIHVVKMCQAFTDNGHEVVLLAPDHKEKYEISIEDVFEFYNVRGGFKIVKLMTPKIRIRSIVRTLSVLKNLLLYKPDLVYGRDVRGCYVSSRLGFDTIFEAHDPMKGDKKFHKLIKSKNLKKLVVISRALKDIFLDDGILSEDKIQVAHDGADEVTDFETEAELDGKQSNLKIGYVGHLYQGKGIEVIEKIAAKVSPEIEFHIVGGLEEDIAYWKNRIHSRNVYFYGFVPQAEISGYINALDICMLPNQKVVYGYREGDEKGENIGDFTSPLKMFEYMAHRKPIIASDLEVLKEVLNDEIAVFADPADENQWIDAIDRLTDKDLRETISRKALEVFKNYTWKNRANKILSS